MNVINVFKNYSNKGFLKIYKFIYIINHVEKHLFMQFYN